MAIKVPNRSASWDIFIKRPSFWCPLFTSLPLAHIINLFLSKLHAVSVNVRKVSPISFDVPALLFRLLARLIFPFNVLGYLQLQC